MGVFGDRESAVAYIRSLDDFQKGLYGDYYVLESELGQPVGDYFERKLEVVEVE